MRKIDCCEHRMKKLKNCFCIKRLKRVLFKPIAKCQPLRVLREYWYIQSPNPVTSCQPLNVSKRCYYIKPLKRLSFKSVAKCELSKVSRKCFYI